MSSTFSGRPRSRLSATSASKNARAWRGASSTALLFGERELRSLVRIGVAFAGGPDRGELLGHPDRGDLRPPGTGSPIQIGAHNVDLAVSATEAHHRDVFSVSEGAHGRPKGGADLFEQSR